MRRRSRKAWPPRASPTRVAASFDKAKNQLLIPLERRRNLNDPVTVELEYGQSHGEPGLAGALALAAPRGETHSTFAHWTVRAPKGWSVQELVWEVEEGDRTRKGREDGKGFLPQALQPSRPSPPSVAFSGGSAAPIHSRM